MSQADFQSVLDTMRIADGTLFPIPITLPVDNLDQVELDKSVALRDSKYNLLAVMDVEEIYEWDRNEVAEWVSGVVGLLLGLMISALLPILISRIPEWPGVALPIALTLFMTYLGATLMLAPRRDKFQRIVT